MPNTLTDRTDRTDRTRRRPHQRLEWGPAKHDPEHPCAAAAADDPRDADGARPDDN